MIVGMDFGTTNSGMAVYDGKRIQLIPLDPHNANANVARTAMYITNDRAVHIGRGALDTYYVQNLNRPFKLDRVRVGEVEMTFAEIGTFIRDVYIEKDVYSPGRLFLSFKMGLSSPEYLGTVVGDAYYFLEDIIATYLYVTRLRAEQFLQTELDTIVLGRPVRYSDDETHNELAKERMLQAAFRAGYKTVYLQYEPIAAAYHYESTINEAQHVLIFDFGGGTLDISIMRLGDAKSRRVLATGGIPIAGDMFDQKIVRNKFPRHFGEGGVYRHADSTLPIPNVYFEAFANWQELLALQYPDKLNTLKQIARAAKEQRKLQALINLITSNYGLKMFDAAEQAKREISNNLVTPLHIEGTGFSVHDSLSRPEFEKYIRPYARAIAERLDEIIAEAGLSHDQIDAVIRTGGSSQIPMFIQMLHERFDPRKVKDIDAFSSVTSGLGIIAHRVETGEIDMQAHRPKDHPEGDYLHVTDQGGIPIVDLGLMQQFIALTEGRSQVGADQVALVTQTEVGCLQTRVKDNGEFEAEVSLKSLKLPDVMQPLQIAGLGERLVMMTSDYRIVLKTAQQLDDLNVVRMSLEESEKFHSDAFGSETVTGIACWDALKDATTIAMITTRGYGRVYLGQQFIEKLQQPTPYQMQRGKGYPAALVDVSGEGQLVIVNHAGRAGRIPANRLDMHDQRLLNIAPDGMMIGAFYIEAPCDVLVATASGYAKQVSSMAMPVATPGTSGEKIISRSNPVWAMPVQAGKDLIAITTRCIVPVDQSEVPQVKSESTEHKLVKLKKGERLVSLAYLP